MMIVMNFLYWLVGDALYCCYSRCLKPSLHKEHGEHLPESRATVAVHIGRLLRSLERVDAAVSGRTLRDVM